MPTYSIAILGFVRVVPLTHLTPLLDGSILEGFMNGMVSHWSVLWGPLHFPHLK